MNYDFLINEIKPLCFETGKFIKENFRKITESDVIIKEKNSLVSFVDQEAERMITKTLANLIPEAGFITEEETIHNQNACTQWIIDPLDGTSNFIAGIPHFSISIALKVEENITLGVVYSVMTGDLYHAIKGIGAFLNDNPIHVSKVNKLGNAIVATGFPYDKSKINKNLKDSLLHFVTNARAIRRLGSAALDLCFVAQGTFDLYYEHFLSQWDIAAGVLIVEEAGGKVFDFSGERDFLAKGEIIAANNGLDDEIIWLQSNKSNC